LADVNQGKVCFEGHITNPGTQCLVIAHPTLCFPAAYQQGETLHLKDHYGRSEILLTVVKPNGTATVLRDGMHFFEPGNVPYLVVPPQQTKAFELGWFFAHSMLRWEDGATAAKMFKDQGQYRIKLLLRNAFPKAALYDEQTKKYAFHPVWTGELASAEVTIHIE